MVKGKTVIVGVFGTAAVMGLATFVVPMLVSKDAGERMEKMSWDGGLKKEKPNED